MKFCFMLVNVSIDAVFILLMIQEEYLAKLMKLYSYFVHLKKHSRVIGSEIYKKFGSI